MAQTHRVVSEYKLPEKAQSNIRVYVRARPLEDGKAPENFLTMGSQDERQIVITDPDTSNRKYTDVSFQFDKVFWTDIGQEEIFTSMCLPQVEHVLEGYNTCCFAYGQTGSGKTYSMFGGDNDVRGVIPRTAEYLFKALSKKSVTIETAVVCSFLEIYNDQIRDLGKAYLVQIGAVACTSTAIFNKTSDIFESLAGKRGNPYFAPAFYSSCPTKSGSGSETAARGLGYKEVQDEYRTMNYEIHEDGDGSVFVKNLSMVPVASIKEVMSMINLGLQVRATHETKLNSSSSRSHTVFTLSVLQRDTISGISKTGMLNLVDLAGSERLKKSESQGVRLKEALHINTSLSALGKVIMSLDPSAESTHIPYRDAKLTRILQNSLGGNAYTVVLAAIHPSALFYDECLSTLQFANRCRNIRNNPRVNYADDPADKDLRLKRMQEELTNLRAKVLHFEKNGVSGVTQGAVGGISAVSLLGVLKKLGIAASLSPDGALTVNGEVHDVSNLEVSSSGDTISTEETGVLGDDNEGGQGTSKDRLRRLCIDLQGANKTHSIKSKERSSLMQNQNKQIQDLSRQIAKLQVVIKKGEVDMKAQKESYEIRATEEMKTTLELQRIELDKISQHNESVLKEQMVLMQNAPNTFKSYTQMMRTKNSEKVDYEEPLRKEFQIQLSALENSRTVENTALKKQYEYFLLEKDTILSDFTAKFTAYRLKKVEQLRLCEEEIVKLFNYAQSVDEILDNIERGVYRVEQKQGKFGKSFPGSGRGTGTTQTAVKNSLHEAEGALATTTSQFGFHEDSQTGESCKGKVILPRGLRPPNPFNLKGNEEMKLSKKIIGKHLERKGKFEKTQKYLEKKTANFGRKVMAHAGCNENENEKESDVHGLDPIVEQHLRDLLGPAGRKADLFSTRIRSAELAKSSRPSSAPAIPKPLCLSITRDNFHHTDTSGQSVGNQTGREIGNQLGHHYEGGRRGSRSITAPGGRAFSVSHSNLPGGSISTSPLQRTSEGHIANWAVERKQSLFDRKGGGLGLGGRTYGPGTGFGADQCDSDEVAQLKAELLEMRTQLRADQQIITGMSNIEMLQYTHRLEEENNGLHQKLRDIHAELRAVKVARIHDTHNFSKESKATRNFKDIPNS